jgi:hypothetical protein
MWHFINPNVKGPLGYPTGYELMPGVTAASLLDPDDGPQKVGAFSAHQLWVTPYRVDERFAAGIYPTDSKGADDGLAIWTKANRPSKTPISLLGIRSASTTLRARKIGRSCPSCGMSSSFVRSISFLEIRCSICPRRLEKRKTGSPMISLRW